MSVPEEPQSPEGAEPSKEEFDREWAELKKRHPSLDPRLRLKGAPRDPVESIVASEAMEAFVRRHATRLRADGFPLENYLAQIPITRHALAKAQQLIELKEEELLHAGADLAEAECELIVETFRAMRALESLTEEQWQAMEPERRTQLWDLLADFRERREEWLGMLPVEERRRVEAEEAGGS